MLVNLFSIYYMPFEVFPMTQNFQRLNPPLGPRTACGTFGPPPDRLQPLWGGCGTSGLPPVPPGRLLSLRATSSTSRPLLAPPGRLRLLQGISRPSGSPTVTAGRCGTSGLPSVPPAHLWPLWTTCSTSRPPPAPSGNL